MNLSPRYSAMFTTVNLLLGVGPLIIPAPFFQAGILLSTIWMIFIQSFSYNAALYIAEAMFTVAQIDKQTNHNLQESILSQQSIQSETNNQFSRIPTIKIAQENNNQSIIQLSEKKKTYDHIEQFSILFGDKYRMVPSISIIIYLLGASISKCIMTGNILARVFEGTDIFGSFNFWLGLFFIMAAAFSFKSIQNTKIMQTVIVVVRFVSVFAMVFGAFFLIFKNGIKTLTPQNGGVFNINYFTQIFSNTVYSFMFHHSLPGISAQTKTKQDTAFYVKYGFLIVSTTMLIIPVTGSMAFGQQLGQHKYIYYNFDFYFHQEVKFVYYIVSFYVFLNIASFSVYVIVLRTNVLKMLKPQINPMKLSKSTLLSTLIILALILLVSLVLQDKIQIVLDFTGGIFGIIIIFMIPCLQVYKARQRVYKKGQEKKYYQSLPIAIFLVGFVFMGFNLYQVFIKL